MSQTVKQQKKIMIVKPGGRVRQTKTRPVRSCTLRPLVNTISFMPDTFTESKSRTRQKTNNKMLKNKLGKRTFVCPCCNIGYSSSEAMIDHIKASPIEVKTYSCEVCMLEFFVKADLTDHQRLDHQMTTQKYKCDECEMDYSCKSFLSKHKLMHQKIAMNLAAFGIFLPRPGNNGEEQTVLNNNQQDKNSDKKNLRPASPLQQTADKIYRHEHEKHERDTSPFGPYLKDVRNQKQKRKSFPKDTCVEDNFPQNKEDDLQISPCMRDILPHMIDILPKQDVPVVHSVKTVKITSKRNNEVHVASEESNCGSISGLGGEETDNNVEEFDIKSAAEHVNEDHTDAAVNGEPGNELPEGHANQEETDNYVDINKSHSRPTAEHIVEEETDNDIISDVAVDGEDAENVTDYSLIKKQNYPVVTQTGKRKRGRPKLPERRPTLSRNGTKKTDDGEEVKIPANLLNEDGSIRCPDCHVMCSSLNGLNRHRKFHFQTMNKLKCIFCDAEFGNGMEMGSHMSSAHPLRKCQNAYMMLPITSVFKCTVQGCSKVFSASVSLTKHKIKEHQMDHSKANICQDCGRRCQSQSALTIHLRCHTDERPFKCDLCPKAYRSSSSLVLHRKSHCSKKPFICEHCGEGFNSPNSLRRHIRCWHTGEKPYMCDGCGATFYDYSQLAQHSKSHGHGKLSSPGKYSCDLCGKQFRTEFRIKSHRQKCGTVGPWRPKPAMCEVCGLEFPSNRNLKNHMVTHSDQRPHKCRYCETTFRHYKSKFIHEKIHKGNKDYICPQCGKGFYQGPNLKAHIASHNNKKEFACCMCGKKFNTDSNVKRHEKRCARYLKCPICAAVFRVHHRLVRHLNLSHSREDLPLGVQCSPVSASSFSHAAPPSELEKQNYTKPGSTADVYLANRPKFVDSEFLATGRPKFADIQIPSPGRPKFVDNQISLPSIPKFVDSSQVSALQSTFFNIENDGQSYEEQHIVDLSASHG